MPGVQVRTRTSHTTSVSLVTLADGFAWFVQLQLLIAVPENGSEPFVSRHNPLKLPPFTLSTLPSADKSLPYPLDISPLGKEEFFEVNKGFEVGSMLKNPMILMMIFSGVIMLGLPYLTVSFTTFP